MTSTSLLNTSRTQRPSLVFLHTSPAHIATFNRLRDELVPGLAVGHIVREDLLCAVQKAGAVSIGVELKLEEALNEAVRAGATRIVCTCSTLGGVAERADVPGADVMRIDRPMGEQAAWIGGRIAVCAALPETIGPTLSLVEEEIAKTGRFTTVQARVFDGVWEDFREGRLRDYREGIAARLRDVAMTADVVVLAQASMAPAAAICGDIGVPVLSSPVTGFKAAIADMVPEVLSA